ncbi:MAG: hemerythrin [Edafosvirus sp.]|uniref:Hemerythrin n=1 Tax=Edafosvirus sp. TaxID=2487765 RepID=A0A3G4ZTT3_9VIRU|nr:MAG: hemerythrin [Edafosvirus sp.]
METTPIEDLMREHGLLNRVLIIYDECVNKINNNHPLDIKIIYYAAIVIKTFIENYHEKTEENYVFPLLKKYGKDIHLVDELYKQHQIGRIFTNNIIKLSHMELLNNEQKIKLANYIRLFVKMYRYHESREDTVIFQDFKNLLSKKDYMELGEIFEKEEERVIGKNGYEKYLDIVVLLEKKLGIHDLSIITHELKSFL